MKKSFALIAIMLLLVHINFAQVGIGTTTPHPSSKLDITSTNSGLLMPRMTTAQRNAIATPAEGLKVFDTDTKTFWFYNGTGWIESATGSPTNFWSLNGTHIFKNNTGNVGIGTNNPSELLTVQSAPNSFGITHTDGTVKLSTYLGNTLGGAWIGTQSNHPVHIYTNNGNIPNVSFNSNFSSDFKGTAPRIRLINQNSNAGTLLAYGNDLFISAFTTSGVTPPGNLILQVPLPLSTDIAAGNVGIGTNTPLDKFSVNAGTNEYGITQTDGTITVGTWVGNGGGYYGTKSNHPLRFFANNSSTQMTILPNGNVGIGASDPAAKLHIIANSAANNEALRLNGTNPFLSFYDAASVYKGYLWNTANDIELGTAAVNTNGRVLLSAKGVNGLMIGSDARVSVNGGPGSGLGIATHPSAFTTNGIFTIKGKDSPFNEWTFWAVDVGHLQVYLNGVSKAFVSKTDGGWIETSDAKLKDDIRHFKPALTGVKNLTVSTYHYKTNKPGIRSFGLIAQNVKEYFPEIVSSTQDKDGNPVLGIAYAKTGVIALKAIQEQQVIIEQQQQKIDELEKRLALLEKLLNK